MPLRFSQPEASWVFGPDFFEAAQRLQVDSGDSSIETRLKAQALSLGFSAVGITTAKTPAGFSNLQAWLAAGYAGQMSYLTKYLAAHEHPRHVLAGVRSLVILSMNYGGPSAMPLQPGTGRVSCYAWGTDYHDLMRTRLHALADWLRQEVPVADTRCVVDTAPLLERDFAVQAGLGWQGKHTLLIQPATGSWFFLGVLLTNLELKPDSPFTTDHCGSCTACLDACPTQAFPQPGVLDARRCISYLTIEHRGPIPRELRPGIGEWLFGCDVCQTVCPWNRFATPSQEPAFSPLPGHDLVNLPALFFMSESELKQWMRGTPLSRTKPAGLLRNAAIVLGNCPTIAAVPALLTGLHAAWPEVRGACAWALSRQELEPHHVAEIRAAATLENDTEVLEELQALLTKVEPPSLHGDSSTASAV